jgi:Zn-dependent protease/CBS domain-containing protein
MPKRNHSEFLGRALTIGTIGGTKVRLHWTFLMFLAWIGIGFLLSGGRAAALAGVLFMIALFACVLAHEFGHIMVARRFGVGTPDVTLLPIGGVARLASMPEQPRRELAIALAGPAVNLVIAFLLIFGLNIEPIAHEHAMRLTPSNVLPNLATANLFLALFNLVPAFPMDGGRALRALLATFVERAKATRIAATIGQTLAIGFGLFGLLSGNPLLIFIAMFVYFGASAEAQDTRLHSLAARLRVADAMITEVLPLSPSSRLNDAVDLLLRSSQREFPVVDGEGRLLGILTRDELIKGIHAHGAALPVTDAMEANISTVQPDMPLSDAIDLMRANPQVPIGVLDREAHFVGLLTPENLGELLLVGLPEANPSKLPGEARVPIVKTHVAKKLV